MMPHLILCVAFFFLFDLNGIKVVYLETKPDDTSEMISMELKGVDSLERCESIIRRLEKLLVKKAKEENKEFVHIYIDEQVRPQIQTESQFGRIGSVRVLYFIK
ncbi:hypothetical protein [Mongoliitalea daihaiensis]|uniref:hypothetical protein n=1 Tax=Mongoliitalea daihaiensis TaxID=2782006 RepID=UPI001F24EEF6|nr:hypothetical protein [Mongoliitalea daihaiensis]UJP63773.1 hypothetical protein IPZ59_13150 [Mongoliitalea daihaiensis]